MKKSLFLSWILAALAGCVTVGTGDREAFRKLTDKKLEELDGKILRWSEARKNQDVVVESVLRRDLRRESGRHAEGLKLAIASKDPWKRATSAAALGFAEDESAVGLLASLLGDDHPDVRAAAMLGLTLTASSRTPVPPVLDRMGDPEPLVRRLAVLCLLQLYDPGTRPEIFDHLLSALQDGDVGVRVNASSALVRLGETRAAPFLAKVALKDEDGLVRKNAAVGLGRLKVPETAKDLVDALEKELSPAVKAEIASALTKVTGRRGIGDDAVAWREALESPAPAKEAAPDGGDGAEEEGEPKSE